jgi:hypothetical protein
MQTLGTLAICASAHGYTHTTKSLLGHLKVSEVWQKMHI